MSLRDAIAIDGQPLEQAALVAGDYYDWQEVDITCAPQPDVQFVHLSIEGADLGAPALSFGDPLWRWRWNPQRAVGLFDARLELRYGDGTSATETFRLRIRPRALDLAQYEALIVAVQSDVRALVYMLGGGREGATLEALPPLRSLVEEYVLLVERLAPEAIDLARQIMQRPNQVLRQRRVTVRLAEGEQLDAAVLSKLARKPGDWAADTFHVSSPAYTGPLPQAVSVDRPNASSDTTEHRLLKYVLRTLLAHVSVVQAALQRESSRQRRNQELDETKPAPAHEQVRRCRSVLHALRHLLADPFLEQVGQLQTLREPTHLIRRVPRYRRLYELYRRLHAVPLLSFDCPTLWLPLQELPLLYEQWCVLQTVAALLPLGSVVEQRLLRQEAPDADTAGRRWLVRLPTDVPLLRLRRADTEVTLVYQRRYKPQPSGSQVLGTLDPYVRVPDIAIEIMRPGERRRVMILDAKYRVAPGGRAPQDALDDAYAYRSAIGVDGRRATLGAFLLFPGTQPVMTTDSVGALPLLPPTNEALQALLHQYLL